MGPSVKFVSPSKGLISKKKIGGPRGVWQKTILFHIFFFEPFPKRHVTLTAEGAKDSEMHLKM